VSEHIEKRKAYVEECRNLYYDANWKPTENRAVVEDPTSVRGNKCRYRAGDKNCAAGRLDPIAEWREGPAVFDTINRMIALYAMKSRGLHSGDDNESIYWLRSVQIMHDNPSTAKKAYEYILARTDFKFSIASELAKWESEK
jgi:hypothetical protein